MYLTRREYHMLNKLKDKKGNEILQVLVVVAVLGAAAIAITIALSKQLRSSTQNTIGVLREGTAEVYGG